MVTAFMPLRTSADSVARWPGPVILSASTGSFGSMAVSTTRLPWPSTSLILAKAPGGIASAGHGTSLSIGRLERGAEAQRFLGDHDGLGGDRLGFQIARLLVRLVVEPDLRDEYGEDAEHDGKSDHHDGAGTHGFCLV